MRVDHFTLKQVSSPSAATLSRMRTCSVPAGGSPTIRVFCLAEPRLGAFSTIFVDVRPPLDPRGTGSWGFCGGGFLAETSRGGGPASRRRARSAQVAASATGLFRRRARARDARRVREFQRRVDLGLDRRLGLVQT